MSNLAIQSGIESNLPAIRLIIEQEADKFLLNLPRINPLSSALTYVLKSGGKRIRPLILLSILSDLEKEMRVYAPLGLSLELLHIASLVHDDLPALDNDNTRRGKNTCHVEFNEATAILTGDTLIAQAFNCLHGSGINPIHLNRISAVLSSAFVDLCYGQQLDINPQKSAEENSKIAFLKTGALFSAAITIPFIVVDAEQSILDLTKEFGLNLGLLYQLCDDLADQYDTVNLKGREVSSDKRNNKPTFYTDTAESNQRTISYAVDKIQIAINILQDKYKINNNFSNLKDSLNLLFKPFKLAEVRF